MPPRTSIAEPVLKMRLITGDDGGMFAAQCQPEEGWYPAVVIYNCRGIELERYPVHTARAISVECTGCGGRVHLEIDSNSTIEMMHENTEL